MRCVRKQDINVSQHCLRPLMEREKLGTGGQKRREQRWDGNMKLGKNFCKGFGIKVVGEV